MGYVEGEILKRLEDIQASIIALHSKIDNFEGFFDASEEEIQEFERELELAKKQGVRLEDLE